MSKGDGSIKVGCEVDLGRPGNIVMKIGGHRALVEVNRYGHPMEINRSFLRGFLDLDENELHERWTAILAKVELKIKDGDWTHIVKKDIELENPVDFGCGCHDAILNTRYLYGLQLGVDYASKQLVAIKESGIQCDLSTPGSPETSEARGVKRPYPTADSEVKFIFGPFI